MRTCALFLSPLLAMASITGVLASQQPVPANPASERVGFHASSDWALIAPHLPNPSTATAAQLETTGDVLRARRFPEDALDYYGYALARGGGRTLLLKKIGIVRLELGQAALARPLFQECVHLHKKDGEAWNDLGATDFELGAYLSSIGEYKRAMRLDRNSAVVHANLGMTYLAVKDPGSARKQFAQAARLDPDFMERPDSGGIDARVLASKDYGEFCFEMATVAAHDLQPDAVKMWLTKASERGFDIRQRMQDNDALRPFLKDPAIQVLLENAARLRNRAALATLPKLTGPDGTPKH
jgi:tetratricopeptide (TPR) repeat protein